MPDAGAAGYLAVAGKVDGIVDVLKQFDANGNPTARASQIGTQTELLKHAGLSNADGSGFLAVAVK
jgi:hypothetical protein